MVNAALAPLGVEICRRPAPHSIARVQIQVLRRYAVDTVIDVGANIGQFARGLRAAGWDGRIISFEPLPSAFATLADVAAGDDRWECHNLALGSQSGRLPIHEAGFTSVSSFLEPTEQYHEIFAGNRGATKQTIVRMERLSTVLDELDAKAIYLKTDTQGYDLQVLRGGGDLAGVVALQCELSFVPLYRDAPLFDAAVAEIAAMEFHPAGFFEVVRDEDMRLLEVDGVFVKGRART